MFVGSRKIANRQKQHFQQNQQARFKFGVGENKKSQSKCRIAWLAIVDHLYVFGLLGAFGEYARIVAKQSRAFSANGGENLGDFRTDSKRSRLRGGNYLYGVAVDFK